MQPPGSAPSDEIDVPVAPPKHPSMYRRSASVEGRVSLTPSEASLDYARSAESPPVRASGACDFAESASHPRGRDGMGHSSPFPWPPADRPVTSLPCASQRPIVVAAENDRMLWRPCADLPKRARRLGSGHPSIPAVIPGQREMTSSRESCNLPGMRPGKLRSSSLQSVIFRQR
jgi:hypothetical protein